MEKTKSRQGGWMIQLFSWIALMAIHGLALIMVLAAVVLDHMAFGLLPQLLDIWVLF